MTRDQLQLLTHLAAVCAVTLAVTLPFAVSGADYHHDGIVFKPALDVAAGKVLFKDVFTQYGALTTLIQAGAIRMFGPFLESIRLITAVFYAFSAMLLWLTWRTFLPPVLATISCLVWIFLGGFWILPFVAWSSVYAMTFQMAACYLLLRYLDRPKGWLVFAAGCSTALAFWARQPVGVFLLGAVVLFCIFARRKINLLPMLSSYLAGACVPTALFLIWLLLSGAFQDFWLQSIVLAYAFSTKADVAGSYGTAVLTLFPQPFTGHFSDPRFSGSLIWSLFPFLAVFSFLDELLLPRSSMAAATPRHQARPQLPLALSDRATKLLLMALVCLASWTQYYPVPCVRHVFWGASPMIGMFFYFFWQVVPDYLPSAPTNPRTS